MSDSIPKVSVIIVNYNGGHLLEECLNSLSATKYPVFEVILVDNNSSDKSIEIVKNQYPACKIIQLPENRGFAVGNNVGAEYATGEYLAFLNNDTNVTPSWLNEIISVMGNDENIAIAQSMLLKSEGDTDSAGDFATKYGRTYNSKQQGFRGPREILSARGAAMAIRKSIFEELGGFDKDYFISFEDVELGWKAWICGYKVIMVPSSIVYHKSGSTGSKMSTMMTFHGLKNQLSLITTHFETGLAIRNVTVVLFSLFFAFMALVFKIGSGKQSFSIDKKAAFKAVFWYIRNSSYIWKKHSRINAQRKRSTKELMNLKLITKRVDEQ